ncbi:hypothetical protein V8E51_000270 [Hyaloscypha variabilis]
MTLRKTILAMTGLPESTPLSSTEDHPAKRFALPALPTELHVQIFKHLDIITATCLGLTNKHLYAVFKRVHGEKPIRFYSLEDTDNKTAFAFTALPDLLEEWMKPMVWGSEVHIYRFITPERLGELSPGKRGPGPEPRSKPRPKPRLKRKSRFRVWSCGFYR